MRALLITLAAGLLASACGQNANVTLEPSDELLSATQQAIAIWKPALDSCGRSLALAYDHPDAAIAYGYTGDDAALTYHNPTIVYLNRDKFAGYPDELARVLAHELGHVLGAKDTNDPSDLMYILRGGDEPNEHDVAQVCGN